jgi:hypothetical protein
VSTIVQVQESPEVREQSRASALDEDTEMDSQLSEGRGSIASDGEGPRCCNDYPRS